MNPSILNSSVPLVTVNKSVGREQILKCNVVLTYDHAETYSRFALIIWLVYDDVELPDIANYSYHCMRTKQYKENQWLRILNASVSPAKIINDTSANTCEQRRNLLRKSTNNIGECAVA